MEQLRLQGKKPSASDGQDPGGNIIMSVEPRTRRGGWLRMLFVGFVLSFFVLCVLLTVQRLRDEGALWAEQLGAFLIEQGIAMPKTETASPNSIN